MTPFSKDPMKFGKVQVIQYMTSVTCYSVKKVTVPTCNYIRYQNDFSSVAETSGRIGSPKERSIHEVSAPSTNVVERRR